MYELKLGTATDQVTFLGETIATPFRGGVLKQSSAGSTAARDIGIVEEIYDLALEGTPSQLSAALASIQRILNQAVNYSRKHIGSPVCLWATPVSGESTWTSPVKCGYLDPLPGATTKNARSDPAAFSSGRDMGSMGIRLFIERFDFWEGALTTLPLSNRAGSRIQYGLAVYNHTDAGTYHDNFVDALGSDIAGDLPTPASIILENTGVSYSFDSLIVNQNVNSAPGALNSILEGTGSSDASCSGGSKKVVTVNTAADSVLAAWTIDNTNLGYCAGNDFMVLLRLANVLAAADVVAHFSLYNTAGTNKLYDLPSVLLPAGQSLIEMGVVTLPPSLAGISAGVYALNLLLSARIASGSRNLEIDYLHLAAMDGYRRYARIGRTWIQNEGLCDDGINAACYLLNFDTGWVTPNFNAFGQPIYLYPSLNQRFHFLHTGANNSEIDRVGAVYIQYKPRKRNL